MYLDLVFIESRLAVRNVSVKYKCYIDCIEAQGQPGRSERASVCSEITESRGTF